MANHDPMVVLTYAQAKALAAAVETIEEPPAEIETVASAMLSMLRQLEVIHEGEKAYRTRYAERSDEYRRTLADAGFTP